MSRAVFAFWGVCWWVVAGGEGSRLNCPIDQLVKSGRYVGNEAEKSVSSVNEASECGREWLVEARKEVLSLGKQLEEEVGRLSETRAGHGGFYVVERGYYR